MILGKKRFNLNMLAVSVLVLFLVFSLWGCGQKSQEEAAADGNGKEQADEKPEEPGDGKSGDQTDGKSDSSSEETSGEKAKVSDRVNKIIENMTLEQKVSQMLVVSFRSTSEDESIMPVLTDFAKEQIEKCGFGGVILFFENVEDTAQTVKLVSDMKKANGSNEEEGRVPMLFAIDQEGGLVNRIPFGTIMPGNMALGASTHPEDSKIVGEIIGEELNYLGINVDFAPVMDVNSNPKNPIIGTRSFSDDPNLVSERGALFIQGLQEKNVASALKHFPGHGDTDTDSHTGLPLINKTLDELRELELIPFKAGVDAGADIIMTAHIQFPEIEKETYVSKADGKKIYLPATLSKTIITGILREEMGYEGVVITDSFDMDAIKEHFDEMDSARLAINAGADIILIPFETVDAETAAKWGDYISGIASMVKKGEIDEALIDAAVARILSMKEARGILDEDIDGINSETLTEEALNHVGSLENHSREREIACRSVTLVKNEDALPIAEGKKVLILVPYGSQQGSVDLMKKYLTESGRIKDESLISTMAYGESLAENFDKEYGDKVKNSDTVIAISSMYGMEDLDWDGAWIIDNVIKTCKDNNVKSVVISTQLPYDLARFPEADALMACYYAKGVNELPPDKNGDIFGWGPNVVSALEAAFGESTPTAKLPVNIPDLIKTSDGYSFGDNLIYERGFGLSY